jgi:RNA polymerase sigma factor (sigma-70 family)
MTAIEFRHQLLGLEPCLEKFAYRLTLRKTDAKDLVQDTFLKVMMNQHKYVINENFKAWTLTIMRNTFINNYRRRFYQNIYYDQEKELFSGNHVRATDADNPDSAYSVMEMTKRIEQLKDILRKPFELYVHGYKYREIADELNLSIGTVKSRIYLSRKLLIDQLNGYAN